jgi:hypothetical protein
MTAITLPPLPEPMHGFYATPMYSPDQLRARDLEVARAVLEGAALKCEGERRLGIDDERAYYGDLMAEAIRELEVKHHE